ALGDRLREHRRLIFLDRPGHGWSERPAGTVSPAQQGALISKLLGQLGIERAIVVAHSFAGAVATAMALDEPHRVAGLVLLAPVPNQGSTVAAWSSRAAPTRLAGPFFTWTLAMPVGTLVTGLMVKSVFAPQQPPADYVNRAAIPLVLRPGNFLANARDVAGLL